MSTARQIITLVFRPQMLCQEHKKCVALTLVQRNNICILRTAAHGDPDKTSRLAKFGDVISMKMSCVDEKNKAKNG